MQQAARTGFELSLQQSRLWSLPGDHQCYRSLKACVLTGDLQVQVLETVFRQLVSRYEILRTLCYPLPGMDIPMQIVLDQGDLSYQFHTLEALEEHAQQAWMEEQFQQARQQPYDLTQSPLLRVLVARLAPTRHFLLMSLPAFCADATTITLLFQDVCIHYTAALEHTSIDDDPLQYVDVATWQEDVAREEDAVQSRTYWTEMDLLRLSTIQLPYEQPEGQPLDVFSPASIDIALSAEQTARLQMYHDSHTLSASACFLACWQIVLSRITAQPEICIGLSCDGRHFEDLTHALGLHMRCIPAILYSDMAHSFLHSAALASEVQDRIREQELYFSWQSLSSEPGTCIFCPLSYEYETWPTALQTGLLTAHLQQSWSCTEPFRVKLHVIHIGTGFRLALEYDSASLSAHHARVLAQCFTQVLKQALNDPQQPVGTLELLNRDEQNRIVALLAGPRRTFPSTLLPQWFEHQVARHATVIAVRCGEQTLTYEQVNKAANQLARYLLRRGMATSIPVGLCMTRSVEMLIGILGILKAGGAYVPLDPEHPPARLAYQLEDSGATLVVTQSTLAQQLPACDANILCLDQIQDELNREEAANLETQITGEDLAYIIYTSGSTGKPKGVMIRHHAIINYIHALREVIGQEEGLHFATVSTLSADLGNTSIFCSLVSGGCLHILPYELVTDGAAFSRYGITHPLDVVKIVPSHLQALLATSDTAAMLPRKLLLLGGEALPTHLWQQIKQRQPGCTIVNHYGPTEATIGTTVYSEETATEALQQTIVPIGRPLANTCAYPLDEHLHLVPEGCVGELYIGGAGLAAGYWQHPAHTQERFRHVTLQGGPLQRLYKTGDLVRYNTWGQLEFVGRVDNQIKIRGHRIELEEIENVLRAHQEVRECAVVLSEDGQQLGACIVPRQQPGPTPADLQAFARQQVPEVMVPASFLLLRALPLTLNGKIDRQQLAILEAQERQHRDSKQAARTPIEELLVGIWQAVLHISPIGIDENFVSLGGHSLLATQVVARIRTALQVEVPLRDFFTAPTIAELAARIETLQQEGMHMPPLVPVSREQPLPLSFAQQRLWLLHELDPTNPAYNKALTRRLSGTLHYQALEHSIKTIVHRHEVLRTTYALHDEQGVQMIHISLPSPIIFLDLHALAEEGRERVAQDMLRQDLALPFDLKHGPLLRTLVIRLDEHDHVLHWTMHHIVSDGWSNEIFLRELVSVYRAYLQGSAASLPQLPIQYADFASWQRRWLQGEVLEQQLRYWREQLRGIQPLRLPCDSPRPGKPSLRGASYTCLLPGDVSSALRDLSQQQGVTLFMVLLSAFQLLLARWTGQQDIVVGTDIANRRDIQTEHLLGFFVNVLVLRTPIREEIPFNQLLQHVREMVLGAYTHQDMPFELLVERLQPEHMRDRMPLVQTLFVMQNVPGEREHWPGLRSSSFHTAMTTAKFDLAMFVHDSPESLRVSLVYSTDLFHHDSMQRLARHFQTLLLTIIHTPDAPVHTLDIYTEEEKEQHMLQKQAQRLSRRQTLRITKEDEFDL